MQKQVKKIDIIAPRPYWDRVKERAPRKANRPTSKPAPLIEKTSPTIPNWAKTLPYATGLMVASGLLITLGPQAIIPALVIGGGMALFTRMKVDEHFYSK